MEGFTIEQSEAFVAYLKSDERKAAYEGHPCPPATVPPAERLATVHAEDIETFKNMDALKQLSFIGISWQ